MRGTFLSALKSDAALGDIIHPDNWHSRGSLTDRPDEMPFGVVAFSVESPGLASIRRIAVDVYVHDERGSYLLVDSALDNVERVCQEMVHVKTARAEILQVEYSGRSGDLEDDGFRTMTRYSSFQIIGKIL